MTTRLLAPALSWLSAVVAGVAAFQHGTGYMAWAMAAVGAGVALAGASGLAWIARAGRRHWALGLFASIAFLACLANTVWLGFEGFAIGGENVAASQRHGAGAEKRDTATLAQKRAELAALGHVGVPDAIEADLRRLAGWSDTHPAVAQKRAELAKARQAERLRADIDAAELRLRVAPAAPIPDAGPRAVAALTGERITEGQAKSIRYLVTQLALELAAMVANLMRDLERQDRAARRAQVLASRPPRRWWFRSAPSRVAETIDSAPTPAALAEPEPEAVTECNPLAAPEPERLPANVTRLRRTRVPAVRRAAHVAAAENTSGAPPGHKLRARLEPFFLECVLPCPGNRVELAALYQAYKTWAMGRRKNGAGAWPYDIGPFADRLEAICEETPIDIVVEGETVFAENIALAA